MRKIITPDKRSAFQFSFHPGMRMLRTLFGLFRFYKLKANKNLSLLLTSSVEGLVKKWVLKDSSIIRALSYRQYMEHQRKRKRLEDLQGEKKSIFFVFRDLHILDWFTPVHRALSEEFKGKYEVIYVDFGSTLKQIGRGFEYFSYKSNVEERLLKSGITEPLHFSDQEIGLFPNFPEPDMIVTSETIKHENFSCQERVYIPHYCVPKQKDVTPVKICFNHLFLAVRPPFCYNEILDNTPISAKIHDVGYPKMHAKVELEVKLFNSGNPVVIFAPSVETTIIMDALRKGILQIFSKMTDLNFIIKLHPTLSADMFDLGNMFKKRLVARQILCWIPEIVFSRSALTHHF